MIDNGRGYHENVNQLTVQHLKEHVKDPTYRDVIQNVVSAISTSCLGGADTFIERKGQLDTLLESVPEETPVQPVAAAVTIAKKKKEVTFKTGDLLMYYWGGVGVASPWPCVVLSHTAHKIHVQWLTCWYPDEFDQYFGATASLQRKALKSHHEWFKQSDTLIPDPRDLQTNDFYYLFRHFEDENTVGTCP